MNRRTIPVIGLLIALALLGCAETYFFLGPGGASSGAPGARATGSGGIVTANGQIPLATQPAAIPGPTYAPALLDPIFESTAGAKAVALGDIDNDGLLDVATISDESQPVQIHLRNATTGLFDTITVGGAGPLSRTIKIALADLNADGKLDIIVLVHDTGFVPPPNTSLEGAVVLLLQGADPRDSHQWQRVVPANMRIGTDDKGFVDMAVADFDGQLGPDIVVLSNEPQSVRHVYLFPNPGPARVADQTSAGWQRFVIETDAADIASAAAVDIDGDGDLDLVMTAPPAKSYNVRWMRNPLRESGLAAVFSGQWPRRIVGQQQGGAQAIAIGDIDGDGSPDVIAVRQ